MQNKVHAFYTIFLLELEDLQMDIHHLLTKLEADHDSEKISNYVYKENKAVMESELDGLREFQNQVDVMDVTDYHDIVTLATRFESMMAKICTSKGHAKSLCIFVNRKMNKVKSYVERLVV